MWGAELTISGRYRDTETKRSADAEAKRAASGQLMQHGVAPAIKRELPASIPCGT